MRFDNFDYDYAVIYFKFLKIQSDNFYKIAYPNLKTYKPEVHQRIRSIETLTTWTLAVRAIPVK